MRSFLSTLPLVLLIFVGTACSDPGSETTTCDITSAEVTGHAEIGDASFCYNAGMINHGSQYKDHPVLSLNFIEHSHYAIFVSFEIMNGEIEFGKTYTTFEASNSYYRDEKDKLWQLDGGSVTVLGSNYPNPSILKYYGTFDLIYSNKDGETIHAVGEFNLK